MAKVVELQPGQSPPAGKPYILVVGVRGLRGEELEQTASGVTMRVNAADVDDAVTGLMAKLDDSDGVVYVRRPASKAQ